MEYERIQKPPQGIGGGGFSPGKLRTMLMGVDKLRKLDDDNDLLRSQVLHSHSGNGGGGGSSSSSFDNCKDVDVVSVLPECSEMDRRLKDNINNNTNHGGAITTRALDCDGGFEFQKGERGQQRLFSKPAPSKWDDAQKWIASPTSNRPRQGRKVTRQSSTKLMVEVAAFDEPDTKQIDTSQPKLESWGQKLLPWEADAYPTPDPYGKPVLMIENSVAESAINLSRHSSSITGMQNAMTFIPPPSTARSVSMRDMGTEMTPIASQEPSRTATPVRATTPSRSPSSSRPSTPPRMDNADPLSEIELQMKTRREIMALGTQLGKTNITAWASKQGEDKGASTSFKALPSPQQQQQQHQQLQLEAKSIIETRATAWEEAEKAKYMARFKREEMKIEAWENHQKAKTEAEMRKIEVEVERLRGRAHEKLMNKLASARHMAEEKRAAAEAKRSQQAVRTEQQAEYIRRTGRIPSLFSCRSCSWSCCF